MDDKILKHLRWNIRHRVLEYLEDRGAGFTEEKYIKPMIRDIQEYYLTSKEDDEDLDEIVQNVADYYLDEIYGVTEKEEKMVEKEDTEKREKVIVRELDKELAGIPQGEKGKKSKEEVEGRVVCRICGARFKVLYPHLLARHHLSPDHYRGMFPNAPLRAGVPEKEHKETGKVSKVPAKAASVRERIVVLAHTIKILEGVNHYGQKEKG